VIGGGDEGAALFGVETVKNFPFCPIGVDLNAASMVHANFDQSSTDYVEVPFVKMARDILCGSANGAPKEGLMFHLLASAD